MVKAKLILFGIAVILASTQVYGKKYRFCKNELSYKDCKYYKDLGFCQTHAEQLHNICPVTCNLCDFGAKKKKPCIDKDGIFNCKFLKRNGVCRTHANLMADRCAKTCNLCDAKDKCAAIKCPKRKECVLDNRGNPVCQCPHYCPYKEDYRQLGKVCASNAQTYKDFCHMEHHACREDKPLRVLFYGTCYSQDSCEDNKAEAESGTCIAWKKRGLCNNKNFQQVMKVYCKKTCEFCEGRVKDPRSVQNCTSTEFGCCWDGTAAPDPKYGQCKGCKDKYPDLCNKFMRQCNSVYEQNLNFMKVNCPATCGFCVPETRKEVEIQIFGRGGSRLYTTRLKN